MLGAETLETRRRLPAQVRRGQIIEAAAVLAVRQGYLPVSPEALAGGTSVAGHRLFATEVPTTIHVRSEPARHLSVSLRSPRAQHLAEWVSISWRSGHAAAA